MAPAIARSAANGASASAAGSQGSDPASSSSSPLASAPAPTPKSRIGKPQLRLLTFNVWGLAYFSKARGKRIPAIAAHLAASEYDIVALQEIWCESSDWRALRERCSVTFPYSKFFYTGAFGSGLAILSRYPIVATYTHPYSLNGHPVLVHHGDWIVAKAAGCATIDISGQGHDLGLVDVWVTHTVAAGGEDGPESRRAHRITQAYELANYARNSAEKGRHVICLGDFNSTPPSLSMAVLRDVGMLSDAFVEAHPDLPANATALPASDVRLRPDPRRSIRELGVTCDSPLNTWTAGKPLDERALKGAGKRLDYILFRGPCFSSHVPAAHTVPDQGRLKCIESSVVFTELMDDLQLSLSDHFGVEAVFEIAAHRATRGLDDNSKRPNVPSAPETSSRVPQTLTSSMSALSARLVASRKTQHIQYLAFTAALLFALVIVILSARGSAGGGLRGAFWTLLMLVCGWAGTTALYGALIWGEWEKRTLRTFLEAMELDLQAQRRHDGCDRETDAVLEGTDSHAAAPTEQDAKQLLVRID